MRTFIALAIIALLPVMARAEQGGGRFDCETDNGSEPYDNMFVAGTVDGEANFEDLYVIYGEGKRIDLEPKAISFGETFELVAIEPGEEDQTVITIMAGSSNGISRAS